MLQLFVTGLSQAEAQSGSLSGRVLNRAGTAIAGAIVTAPDAGSTALSGENGRWRLDGLPAGPVRVLVSADGYRSQWLRPVIEANRESDLDVVLQSGAVQLERVVVGARAAPGSVAPAADVLGTMLTAGAKSEVLELRELNGNIAEKTPRQIFARVPGVFVYDMDGSGNQVNVSTRGLDAHRSWELNVRQDGVLINSDIYGYPASHYSPPMEAIQRIELIRGTAALQYGSQFGGLLNYVTREPEPGTRPNLLASGTAGSHGLVAGYASLGASGTAFTYHAYAQARRSDGFRDNGRSESSAQFGALTWHPANAFELRGQIGRSEYLYRTPGPLTDSLFRANPRASTRARNYFNPDIIVPALRATWRRPGTQLSAQLSGVFGTRSSVQFVGFATVRDSINPATGEHNARTVDIDRFNSVTGELRLTGEWRAGVPSVLAAGLVVTDNDLHRRQQGTGTTGTDYDLTVGAAGFRRNVHFLTRSAGAYAENSFRFTERWSVVPGVRIERGTTNLTGTLAYHDPADVPTSVNHDATLLGLRTLYRDSGGTETYAGWSQAHRPMILKDLLPDNALERADPAARDANGWTLEAGRRGNARGAYYDASVFALRYDDRFGVLSLSDAGGPYLLKTNVGSSLTRGAELLVDAPVLDAAALMLRFSMAASYFDAVYRRGSVVVSGQNVSIAGKRVESVPRWIARAGVNAVTGRTTATLQVSHTTESYADALNTRAPSATGSVGLVPAYTLVDLNGSFRVRSGVRLRGGVSNLGNVMYFTKRPSFYPGPGVWPSDGRSYQLGMEVEAPLGR